MIISKLHIGWKLFAQIIAVMIVLITTDAVTGWSGWSITYLEPFVIIAATLVMTLVLLIRRAKWREYMLFQFLITINGFISIVLYCFGLIKVIWPGATGAIYALLTLFGMYVFANKQFKNELYKRFHI